ncbi:MAG: hypothetical protein FWE67_05000 [Planctomycetaceae bacterium]|nr:hypothetical protein [Planctomycetaceae bacterium]
MIIYWHRFAPRVVILLVIAFLVWLNQETFVTLAVQRQIENRTGAGVRLESIQGDVLKGNAVVNNLSIYDRKNPQRKLISAARITVEGDFENIAKRYFVFPQITAEGIHITVDGVDGQQFVPDKLWLSLKDTLAQDTAEFADKTDWTQFFSQKPDDAVKQILSQLKTSKTADEVNSRWAKDVKKIEETANGIKSRFQKIKQIVNKQNPSDSQTSQVNQFLIEVEAINVLVQKFLTDVNQLNEKAKTDYQSLLDSVNQDRNSIKKISLPKFSSESISESLIGPEVKEQWSNMLTWSEWLRSLLSPDGVNTAAKVNKAKGGSAAEHIGFISPKRFRGETIHFAALDARPEIMIETLNLTGKMDFGAVPLYFNGKVDKAAFSMHLAPAPTIIQCCFSGQSIPISPIQAEVNEAEIIGGLPDIFTTISIDRIGQNEVDNLVFHCPKYRLPARLLGRQEQFAVAVSPGVSQLDGMLVVNNGQLSGRIRMIQTETKLSAVLPAKAQNTNLHRTIQGTLNTLDGFNAEVLVSGTKDDPQYVFTSDIADKIRPSLEQLLQAEWDEIKQRTDTQMTAEANAAVDTLRTAVNDKINPLTAQINTEQQQWQQQLQQFQDVPVQQLIQKGVSSLSEKDKERIGQALNLLQQKAPGPQEQLNGKTLEDAVNEGVDKLQKKLPGALDKYLNK